MAIKFIMRLIISYFLPLFIPFLIVRIKFKPSFVRCEPSFISLAILHQSEKSFCFIPSTGYFLKKGMIKLVISEYFTIVKETKGLLFYLYIVPLPKYLEINSIKILSLSSCLILILNITW
jgi:hypothetical protein